MHHHSVISRPGHRSRRRESSSDVLRGGDSGDEPGARGGCRLVGGIQPASVPEIGVREPARACTPSPYAAPDRSSVSSSQESLVTQGVVRITFRVSGRARGCHLRRTGLSQGDPGPIAGL